MKNKFLLVSLIENIDLEDDYKLNFFGWTITKDFMDIVKVLPCLDSFYIGIGCALSNDIAGKTVGYKIYESESPCHKGSILRDETFNLDFFLSSIWAAFDNSIFVSISYLQDAVSLETSIHRSNRYISNSRGEYGTLFLSRESEKSVINQKTVDFIDSTMFNVNENSTNESRITNPKIEDRFHSYTRLQRAFLLLDQARLTCFLPMKIGLYINTLECLLLKSETELNFRLQLYVANLIGDNKEDKIKIMNIIKLGYSVRSKFFHGEGLKKDVILKLDSISYDLDCILRKSINKLIPIRDTINENKKFEQFSSTLCLP